MKGLSAMLTMGLLVLAQQLASCLRQAGALPRDHDVALSRSRTQWPPARAMVPLRASSWLANRRPHSNPAANLERAEEWSAPDASLDL